MNESLSKLHQWQPIHGATLELLKLSVALPIELSLSRPTSIPTLILPIPSPIPLERNEQAGDWG